MGGVDKSCRAHRLLGISRMPGGSVLELAVNESGYFGEFWD